MSVLPNLQHLLWNAEPLATLSSSPTSINKMRAPAMSNSADSSIHLSSSAGSSLSSSLSVPAVLCEYDSGTSVAYPSARLTSKDPPALANVEDKLAVGEVHCVREASVSPHASPAPSAEQHVESTPARASGVCCDGGDQSATLLSTTPSFWFNGRLTRVESVRLADGRKETRVAAPASPQSAWATLDHFRVPCQFMSGNGGLQDAEDYPATLLKHTSSDSEKAVAPGHTSELNAVSSSCAHSTQGREWVSVVEETVAAHVSAETHRQLFSWVGACAHPTKTRASTSQKEACIGNGEKHDALLQWWSLLH